MWIAWSSLAQSQSLHPFRTPQAIALSSQLRAPSPESNTKLSMPLTDWIQSILVQDQIPIWLDRRIPSDIELAIPIPRDQTNKQVIELVASHINAQVAYVDRYVLIVPRSFGDAIEWSYWNLCCEPSHRSLRVTQKEGLEWSDGADTREIWNAFTEKYRLDTLVQTSKLTTEFDRWQAFRLESTNPAAIATVLLSGYDESLVWPADGPPSIASLSESFETLKKSPDRSFVRFQYSSEIPKIGKVAWQEWRARWPQATVTRVAPEGPSKSESWEILAPVAAHRELVEPLAPTPKPKPTNPSGSKKYTGRYRGEILKILESLSSQLSLQLTPKNLTDNLARKEVDVSFQDATIDELLAKLAQASGLIIALEGRSIRVEAPNQ
jgi:hypothetical protein